jgi:hypothetical protein
LRCEAKAFNRSILLSAPLPLTSAFTLVSAPRSATDLRCEAKAFNRSILLSAPLPLTSAFA